MDEQAIIKFMFSSPLFVYVVLFVRALIFTTLEAIRPARPHSYWPVIRSDLASVAVYIYVVFPFAIYLNRVVPGHHAYPFSVAGLPLALKVVLYFILADFGYYWVHRLMHTRYFWRTHMWHHSPTYIYWLGGMRATVFQQFLVNIPYILAYPLLGGSPWWMFLAIAEHVGFKNDWQHMNVTWRSNWLEWLVVTPRYHHIHHSANPEHYVANLGDLLTVWDRLFGTYVNPGPVRGKLSFGIDSKENPVRLVLGV